MIPPQHRLTPGCFMLIAVACTAIAGCDIDSFADPSNIGRWENTPVVLPILERLDVIDEPVEEILGLSDVTSEDLIPEVTTYVIGPGDTVTVTVFGLITQDVDSVLTRRVDELGYIDLPVINEIRAAGRTPQELEDEIVDALDPDILRDPIVTVVVTEGRQRTFTIFGTPAAGPYTILKSNFRLLDAVALGGGLPPGTEKVYVVRQVALSQEAEGRRREEDRPGSRPGADAGAPEQAPQDPAQVLEELTKPAEEGDAPGQAEGEREVEAQPPPRPLREAVESAPPPGERGRFINVDGKWVRVEDKPEAARAQARQQGPGAPRAAGVARGRAVAPEDELITQRVIEIDAEALMRGEARQNIVVRPNDIIRVPDVNLGYVFVEGAISRPGSYSIEGDRKLTLTALIASAGGLDPVAIPERLDLYRRIGKDQQAIVRLNLRAIAEGVQPNIFLKPEDEIRIGTSIYASFLAVIRNSFRMSYGFGFLLDRNFGNDVFGPPPESFGGGRGGPPVQFP